MNGKEKVLQNRSQKLKYFDDFSHVVIWTLKIVALDAGISMRCFFFKKLIFLLLNKHFSGIAEGMT